MRVYYKTPQETLDWLNKHLTPEVIERAKVYGERLRIAAENRKNQSPTQDFYDGCRRLSDELDLELLVHITPTPTAQYFAIHRTKPCPVFDGDKYVMLPFSAPVPPVS